MLWIDGKGIRLKYSNTKLLTIISYIVAIIFIAMYFLQVNISLQTALTPFLLAFWGDLRLYQYNKEIVEPLLYLSEEMCVELFKQVYKNPESDYVVNVDFEELKKVFKDDDIDELTSDILNKILEERHKEDEE